MSKKLKLDREKFERLKELLGTDDRGNHAVAFGIISNLDIKADLPYILLLYMKYHTVVDEKWLPFLRKVNKVLEAAGQPNLENTTYDGIYWFLKKDYPGELQVMLDQFCEIFKGQLKEWKHSFLDDVDFTITVRDGKTN